MTLQCYARFSRRGSREAPRKTEVARKIDWAGVGNITYFRVRHLSECAVSPKAHLHRIYSLRLHQDFGRLAAKCRGQIEELHDERHLARLRAVSR
jgi:hypothetical protein